MILTGKQIELAREEGYLDISDFDRKRLNPNSYNLRLADEIGIYGAMIHNKGEETVSFLCPKYLDMKEKNFLVYEKIPEEGYILQPGKLYLARTMEYTETHKFVPMLEGRSSVGRLGISVHSTAGFGDIGFCGYWTLEISCVQPVKIYPGVEICQIYYHSIGPAEDIWIPDDGNPSIMKYDKGKYQKNTGIQPSMMWKEFL